MSAPFSDLYITSQGNAMTALAWASSGVITITSVQFGSGFPGVSDNIPGYTALKNPITNGQITGENVLIAGQCTIRVNLAGIGIPSTFQINEIGVFASFAAGAPQLVAYMSTGAATGDTLFVGSPVVKDYAILVTFSQGVITSVNISLLQTVGLHAPNHLDNGIDPMPLATTARTGLVPKSTGTGLSALFDTIPISWKFVTPAITANLTLYVATTGNDATALPNNPSFPWLTIQGALNYLIPYFIEPGFTVTVSVAAGVYNVTSPIAINHPNGQNIQIVGTAGATITATSASVTVGTVTLTGGAGAFSGLAAGQYIAVRCAQTVGTIFASGVWKVVSAASTTVTYNTGYAGAFPTLSGWTSGTVIPLTTRITTSTAINGIVVSGNGVGLISNIALIGTSSGSTVIGGLITTSGNTNITNVHAYNWLDSSGASAGFLSLNNSVINATLCYASLGAYGFSSSGTSQLSCGSCIAQMNTSYGIAAQAVTSCMGCFANGNGLGGLASVNGGVLTISANCQGNYNNFGLLSSTHACVISTGSPGSQFINNLVKDIQLSVLSSISRPNGSAIAFGTSNIAVTTLSADGCYFSP